MSVTGVDMAVNNCVTMSLAATAAFVEGDIHSHLIIKHVKVRNNEFIYSLPLT